jgi:SPP1 gp7 family putative phage head morphogenesis protein
MHVKINTEPIEAALKKVYTDGFLIGLDASKEAIGQAVREQQAGNKAAKKPPAIKDELLNMAKGDGSDYVDWANWKPGNRAAALLYRPTGAFKTILDNAGIVSKTIAKAGYDRIGTALADSVAAGFSPARAAKVLTEKIGDPARALTIAITEQNRAMSLASMENYANYGVEKVEWSGANPCDICAPNEGQVVETGQEFNSGDTEPPVHPNCRCAILPVIDEAFYAEPSATDGLDLLPNEEAAPVETAVQKEMPPSNLYDGTTAAKDLKGSPITAKEINAVYSSYKPTEQAKEAFADYQESGFFKLNTALRAGENPPPLALEMDKAFADAPKVPGFAREYYRTSDSSVFADIKKGQLFVDKGYTSTSISKSEALTFGEDAMYDAKIRIIDVGNQPKIWIDAVTGAEGRSQQEVVFQRGTPFTYVGVDNQGFHVLITGRRN